MSSTPSGPFVSTGIIRELEELVTVLAGQTQTLIAIGEQAEDLDLEPAVQEAIQNLALDGIDAVESNGVYQKYQPWAEEPV